MIRESILGAEVIRLSSPPNAAPQDADRGNRLSAETRYSQYSRECSWRNRVSRSL